MSRELIGTGSKGGTALAGRVMQMSDGDKFARAFMKAYILKSGFVVPSPSLTPTFTFTLTLPSPSPLLSNLPLISLSLEFDAVTKSRMELLERLNDGAADTFNDRSQRDYDLIQENFRPAAKTLQLPNCLFECFP